MKLITPKDFYLITIPLCTARLGSQIGVKIGFLKPHEVVDITWAAYFICFFIMMRMIVNYFGLEKRGN